MSEAVTRADRVRQVGVTVSEVACVLGTLVGVGVLGTPVAQTGQQELAADATLLAPAGPAFSIWSVVYLGLFAYTVWQWLPGQASRQRHRAIGWWVAASMLLNAGWLLVVQQGWIWVSVAVIIALALVLKTLVGRLTTVAPAGAADRVVTDGTFGLYLGWVAVATCANITAALVGSGVEPGPTGAAAAAVAVLAVVAVLGVLYARWFGARVAVAAAMAWGLAWIVVGRLGDDGATASVPTAVAAGLAALVVLGAVVATRAGGPGGPRGLRPARAR